MLSFAGGNYQKTNDKYVGSFKKQMLTHKFGLELAMNRSKHKKLK
ncbi:hypothetical protein [Zunongwangia sp.]